jgi:hypothetical protein
VSGLGKLQGAGAVAASLPNTHGYPSPPSSLPDPPPPPRPFGAAFSATTPSATFATPALPSANTTSALSSSATAIQTQVTPESIQLLRKNPSALLSGSAIADGHGPDRSNAARSRRASEGAGVLGATGKLGRLRSGSELKCDKCGKGYKHSSCLTKHLCVLLPCLILFICSRFFYFGLLAERLRVALRERYGRPDPTEKQTFIPFPLPGIKIKPSASINISSIPLSHSIQRCIINLPT